MIFCPEDSINKTILIIHIGQNIMTTKPMQHLLNQEVTASLIDQTHLEPRNREVFGL
jgi:hypothetical protein